VSIAANNNLQALEQSVYQQINQYRRSRGLPVLAWDERISQQARQHSQSMANGSVPFSHNGFEERLRAIASQVSYNNAAENVAFNQGFANPDNQAVQGWITSLGHRRNLEGQFNLTGIGVAQNSQGQYYFTQIFVAGR
jgi:uncharacterized protein YkwD